MSVRDFLKLINNSLRKYKGNKCLMSVWKSDEVLLSLYLASLISPKVILFEKQYEAFDTVFHHWMKYLEVRQKYSVARRIFNSPLISVFHL